MSAAQGRLLRWHRGLFRLIWRRKSRPKTPQTRITPETIALIRQMRTDNITWGAERIRGELLSAACYRNSGSRSAGVSASRTIQRYLPPETAPATSPSNRSWSTFLQNHADQIWACDFTQVYNLFFAPPSARRPANVTRQRMSQGQFYWPGEAFTRYGVAMVIAGFSGGEADHFRRALSRSRSPAELNRIGQRFVQGASERIGEGAANILFSQLAGFASYGFCKSHAAAFALLAYQTMWLKLNHPREFYTALLNQQPMGFYTPAVIVGDAKRHGVMLLPPDLNRSQDACRLEEAGIRLGLRYLKGLGPAARQSLLAGQPFTGLRDLCRRTRLPQGAIEALIRAGALDSLNPDRRRLLWELGLLDYRPLALDLEADIDPIALPALTEAEAMVWSLDLLSMAPGDHLLRLYRPALNEAGILSAAELERRGDGEMVKVAGQVVVRQSPPTAKGHLFLTLEDETGLANLIVRPALYTKRYETLRYAPLLAAAGRVQREGEACNLLVQGVWEVR